MANGAEGIVLERAIQTRHMDLLVPVEPPPMDLTKGKKKKKERRDIHRETEREREERKRLEREKEERRKAKEEEKRQQKQVFYFPPLHFSPLFLLTRLFPGETKN